MSLRVTRRPGEGFLTPELSGFGVARRAHGRISRSRIRPTNSQAAAPSPQLNRAFLVSAFSPVNCLMPLSLEKIPRSTAVGAREHELHEVVVLVGVQRDQQRPDGEEHRGDQEQQPDHLGEHHPHPVDGLGTAARRARRARRPRPPVSILVPSPRPNIPLPSLRSATLEGGLARPLLDEGLHTGGAVSGGEQGRERGPLDLQPGVQVDLETAVDRTPSRPAARGRPHRRTGRPRRPPRRRPAPSGTTRSTSPIASASSALTNRPVKMRSLARLGPMRRLSRWVPPAPGMIPSSTSGCPSWASSCGEPDVGRQRQLAPAAERVAGDRGDHRLRDPGHRGHRGLHGRPELDHVGVRRARPSP